MFNPESIGADATCEGRPLTNVERLLYRAPYCDIIMLARFKTILLELKLREALSAVRLRYPMMNARIEQDESGNARFAADYTTEFEIKVFDKISEVQWLDLAWNAQKIPFNLSAGPLIRFLLLNAVDSTDLVVICHHAICDGLSLSYLIKDTARFLLDPGLKFEPLPFPPGISDDAFPFSVKPAWLIQFVVARLNRSWQKTKKVFVEADYVRLFKTYWQANRTGVLISSLSQDATSALISKCRAEGVTVNSAIITALSYANFATHSAHPSYLKKALMPINVRNLFKHAQNGNFGLLALGAQVPVPSTGRDFWEIARRFDVRTKLLLAHPKRYLKQVAPLNCVDPTLIDAIYFSAYDGFRNQSAKRFKGLILTPDDEPRRGMSVTNLGLIETEGLKYLDTIVFVPILSTNYEKLIGIATAGGKLNVTMMYDESKMSRATIETFSERCFQYLS
jgi:Condensation domain